MSKSKSIKTSPNYDQQIEEIELLKNIIPENLEIINEEPNFHIQIKIIGKTSENPIKTFFLNIFLNYYYPEKSPRFTITEINNLLSAKNKEEIEEKIIQCCKENLGFPVIYQIYEIVQELADEEEKKELLKKEIEAKKENPYHLNQLKKIKNINIIPKDIILLKNGNVLIITENDDIIIYDNKFENILLETLDFKLNNSFKSPYFWKYFPNSQKNEADFLYIFGGKEVLVIIINYLNKKYISNKEIDMRINGNIKIKLIDRIEYMVDVIEFPEYPNRVFFIHNEETEYLLYEYKKIINNNDNKNNNNQIKLQYINKIIPNNTNKVFRKLYKINSEKFIIASYIIFNLDNFVFEGISKMYFVDIKTFKIRKEHDINISPIENNMCNYKDHYLIVSYFGKKHLGEYYSGKLDHFIGIFDVNTEELVTIIEFDLIKRIYNINDNILFICVKNYTAQQIIDRHSIYFRHNKILQSDTFGFLSFEEEVKITQEIFDYDNIFTVIEINKGILVIVSYKKGITLYSM